MKRFATSVAICAALMMGVGAYADKTWDGSTDATWHTNANWTPMGCPGCGSPARCCDRAIIDICEDGGVIFSSSSGDATFGSRAIQELLIRGGGTEGQPSTLVVSGDVLRTERLTMDPEVSGEEAVLSVTTTDNAFQPNHLLILSGTANAQIEVDADLIVGKETTVNGTLDVEITAGKVFDMGRLTCISCIIRRATITVSATCGA